MARGHGRILATIWSDPDFLALGPGPQRLYMFLLSQPDLAHCGLIALRERRWARTAEGLTADAVSADLGALADSGFVVVDHDTEEVLVRSLIRRDDVWRQPNVLAAAVGQFGMVTSPRIRTALAAELRRIRAEAALTERAVELIDTALTNLPEQPTGNPSPNPSGNPSVNPCRNLSPNPSGKGSANPSGGLIRESAERSGVGERYVRGERVPLPPSPQVPPPAGAAAAHPPRDTAQAIIGEYVAGCTKRPPGQVLGHLGKVVAGMLAEGIQPSDVRRGVAAWSTKGLHPATLPAVVNEVMNTRASPVAASRPSTTDARVSAALALAAKYAGQEAAAS